MEWLIHIEKYCQTDEEEDVLRDSVKMVLNLAKYQYYPLMEKRGQGNILDLVSKYGEYFKSHRNIPTRI